MNRRPKKVKVLFAASEGYPFAKTGGLGDVIGSLPTELKKKGIDIRVIMPKYGQISDEYKKQMKPVADFCIDMNWRKRYCGIEELHYNGIVYYFIDNEYYFKKSGYYGYSDDGEKFVYFSKAILEGLKEIGFRPDIIHCHDWHTALVPFLIKNIYKEDFYQGIKTILTIHNLKYQGIFLNEALNELLGLHDSILNSLKFNGYGNLLKGGITWADLVTTVSPTYAKEIQEIQLGEKLDAVLRENRHKIRGILNGIDYSLYNPETDRSLYKNYKDSYLQKVQNKIEFQKEFDLSQDADIPMIAIVSRLTEQKGIDLIQAVIHRMLDLRIQFIVLGVGEDKYEKFFKDLALQYPDKFRAFIQFDDDLSRRIYGSADMVLMPSQFEPCGLTQLIAMRYGTVPIARATGGLKDTVMLFENNEKGTGFTFEYYEGFAMLEAIEKAITVYRQKEKWRLLFNNTIHTDLSWEKSVVEYIKEYNKILNT